jgi:hypothetical protein
VISVSQLDLNGNAVEQAVQAAGSAGSPGKLAVMAATGTDMRLLLVILIMLQLPIGDLMSAAGC